MSGRFMLLECYGNRDKASASEATWFVCRYDLLAGVYFKRPLYIIFTVCE